MNREDIDPAGLAALIARLPAGDLVVVAARVGLDMGDHLHRVANDRSYDCKWHSHVVLGPSELQRRRYPPNGNVEEWILFGPAGAPRQQKGGAAA